LNGGGNFGGMSDPTLAGFGNGYGSTPAQVLRVNNVTIQASQGVGVYLDANAAFTNDSQQLQITGSGGRPVSTTMMSLGSLPSGSYVGNATDEILIFGPNANVFGDMTVEDRGVPVRIAYGAMNIGPAVGATAAVTLTLKPGVVFKFPRIGNPLAPGARVTFGTNGARRTTWSASSTRWERQQNRSCLRRGKCRRRPVIGLACGSIPPMGRGWITWRSVTPVRRVASSRTAAGS
jgi:hypothetical protein